jgi:hypothetical protein
MFCKKWLSLFLIFVLCFSFLQVPALAVTSDGTGNTSDNMLQPGSIQLSGDQASESYSEPSSDHVQESPVETTPLPTADPAPLSATGISSSGRAPTAHRTAIRPDCAR